MIFIFVIFAALTSSANAGSGFPENPKMFTLNNAVGQNLISFTSEAPQESFTGTADKLTGTFTMDKQNLEATKGKLSVEVRSMKTAIARRDLHMYSSVWLDADKYPEITFEISNLSNVKSSVKEGKTVATATASGTFSCHGVTKPLTAVVAITYVPESSETIKRASGDLVMITATFDVALQDFNITGKEGLIGSSVGAVIHITANIYANS